MPIDSQQVLTALRAIKDPELHKDIVTLGLVKRAEVKETTVYVTIDVPTHAQALSQTIDRDVRTALARIGATQLDLQITGSRQGVSPVPNPAGAPRAVLPQVQHVIAVGAGKGGVGKSTLAVNLAVGLQRLGHQVGLMDGDIYGPSMPTLLGIKGQQPQVRGPKIIPFHVHGLHAITIGALVEQDKPLIWRGPMAHGAFKQLFSDNTEWPPLNYMIVDLPPGTGDVPLTLCQLLPLTGAVVVATPQQVALDDAIRAVRMFQQLGAPILGIVENMSYMPLPDGTTADIFGRGGAQRAAQEYGLPFLGALPLYPELRVNSDAGDPSRNFTTNPDLSRDLTQITQNLINQVQLRDAQSPIPQLNIT